MVYRSVYLVKAAFLVTITQKHQRPWMTRRPITRYGLRYTIPRQDSLYHPLVYYSLLQLAANAPSPGICKITLEASSKIECAWAGHYWWQRPGILLLLVKISASETLKRVSLSRVSLSAAACMATAAVHELRSHDIAVMTC